MKRACRLVLSISIVFGIWDVGFGISHAAVPGKINYQGKLTDAAGRLVSDGSYDIVFTLFDDPSAGDEKWSETLDNVQVTNGIINVLLGSTSDLSPVFRQNDTLSLEIAVEGETLSPRQQVVSAGYALRAYEADDVKDGVITADSLATGAVTADKIGSGAVSSDKIGADAFALMNRVPVVTGISPEIKGLGYSSFTATITGENFQSVSQAKIGTVDLTGESVVASTSLTASVPGGLPAGIHNVSVSNINLDWGTGVGLFVVNTSTPTPTPTSTSTPTPTVTPTSTPTSSLYGGLVAYYKLDETSGTTAVDSQGSHHGTNNGATVNQPGKIGTAYSFGGDGDYINIPHHASLNPIMPFSISMWIKGTSYPSQVALMGKTQATNDGYDLRLPSTASRIDLVKYSVAAQGVSIGYSLSNGVWYHIAAVQDATQVKYYVNGVNVNTFSGTAIPITNTEPVHIGNTTAPDSQSFNGVIDEVGFWNKALSLSEISELWNNGSGKTLSPTSTPTVTPTSTPTSTLYGGLVAYYTLDETSGTTAVDSQGSHHGTNNGATVNQPGKIGTAYSFGGDGDYINIPHHASLNPIMPFSISMWIKGTSYPSQVALMGKTQATSNGYDLRLPSTASQIDLVKYVVAAQGVSIGYSLSAGVWYHIAAVQDATQVKYYVNGVNVNTFSGTAIPITNTEPVHIGNTTAPDSQSFNGVIDEVGFWNKDLSSPEISELWNSGSGKALF